MDINVNGRRFKSWDDVPVEIRQQLMASGVFHDADDDGVPDELQRPVEGTVMKHRLVINGQEYDLDRPVPSLLRAVIGVMKNPGGVIAASGPDGVIIRRPDASGHQSQPGWSPPPLGAGPQGPPSPWASPAAGQPGWSSPPPDAVRPAHPVTTRWAGGPTASGTDYRTTGASSRPTDRHVVNPGVITETGGSKVVLLVVVMVLVAAVVALVVLLG